jgi:hypothetical protein
VKIRLDISKEWASCDVKDFGDSKAKEHSLLINKTVEVYSVHLTHAFARKNYK